MDKNKLNERLAELRVERGRLVGELETARAEARDALIAGKKPAGTAAALAERIAIVDDAIAELQERTRSVAESAERNNRKRRTEQQGRVCEPSPPQEIRKSVSVHELPSLRGLALRQEYQRSCKPRHR